MKYQSSRGKYQGLDAAEVIKMGIAPDGGLFVPESIPRLEDSLLRDMESQSYQQRAVGIMQKFLSDFSSEQIENCVSNAYNTRSFDNEQIAPLVNIKDRVFIQELWHGPTCAFKDMALQILPYLLTASVQITREKDEIIILVATSGDTGKAALEGFRDVDKTGIIVFFPQNGVSEIQKRQMVTQEGNNVYVAAVEGNFDDAQNGVKEIFGSRDFNQALADKGKKLSSANSINWGRLLPQIVYYVSAYIDLKKSGQIKAGEGFNIVVPTGNFGNILAAFYARQMGIPVKRLICASNSNNVLTDFIRTGIYDRNRKFEKTISPSMDILISSNLERLLYELTGHDAERVNGWMNELKTSGRYQADNDTLDAIQQLFWPGFCDDESTIQTIRDCWQKYHYLLDTHTAVAFNVYGQYVQKTGDNSITTIASTASPFKFGSSVAKAVVEPDLLSGRDEFELLQILSDRTGVPIPRGIKDLDKKEIRHSTVCAKEEMQETVWSFLTKN